jgi:hypothetical protein
MTHLDLNSAVLCGDLHCNTISDAIHSCPACGGRNLLSLASILNRPEPDETFQPSVTHLIGILDRALN